MSETSALCRVFVCDDQPDIRHALAEVLANLPGFEQVGEAADGAVALRELAATKPDLLILDINMPHGGPPLAAAAKAAVPGLKIVVFSALRDERTMDEMRRAGADDYVVKTGRLRPLSDALYRAIAPASAVANRGD